MFKKSTITLLFLMIGTITAAQEGPKLKFDEPDDVFWDNRFGDYGADGFITDMEYVNADTIFLAGTFNTINGYHTPGIAMWNGSFWEAVPANNDQLGDVHETFVSQDVAAEENYLACSMDVKSEIVVPIMADGEFVAQLDIDSNTKNSITEEQTELLEKICEMLSAEF